MRHNSSLSCYYNTDTRRCQALFPEKKKRASFGRPAFVFSLARRGFLRLRASGVSRSVRGPSPEPASRKDPRHTQRSRRPASVLAGPQPVARPRPSSPDAGPQPARSAQTLRRTGPEHAAGAANPPPDALLWRIIGKNPLGRISRHAFLRLARQSPAGSCLPTGLPVFFPYIKQIAAEKRAGKCPKTPRTPKATRTAAARKEGRRDARPASANFLSAPIPHLYNAPRTCYTIVGGVIDARGRPRRRCGEAG